MHPKILLLTIILRGPDMEASIGLDLVKTTSYAYVLKVATLTVMWYHNKNAHVLTVDLFKLVLHCKKM